MGGQLVGVDCDYDANVFLMSTILFAGALFISITLKNFRSTGYFPGKVRNFLSDFAVVIAILIMSRGAFTYDVKSFWVILDLLTYLPLSDIVRCGLTCLPTPRSDVRFFSLLLSSHH